MASTARAASDKVERFDEEAVLDSKVKDLAARLKNSKHAIAFTGAGISTAAGIADFRSGINTVLTTGPGKWEKDAHKGKTTESMRKAKTINVIKAHPTFTHMALKTLLDHGILKFLISQNTDGLHRRSGIPKSRMAELHGNTNLEFCKSCGREYLRDFRVRNSNKCHSHETGRVCDNSKCGGKLRDSIINFGENLPEDEIDAAFLNSKLADCCIALGSSLTVTPAADCPAMVGRKNKRNAEPTTDHGETTSQSGGDLYIVNLQPTPLDALATERLNGMCDTVMRRLMEELGIPVPSWKLVRGISIKIAPVTKKKVSSVSGGAGGRGSSVNSGSDPSSSSRKQRSSSTVRTSTASKASVSQGGGGSPDLATTTGSKNKVSNSTAQTRDVACVDSGLKTYSITVAGINIDTNTPYTLFSSVEILADNEKSDHDATGKTKRDAPFRFERSGQSFEDVTKNVSIKCSFMGNYCEPDLVLPCQEGTYMISLDFAKMQWIVEKKV